VPAFSLVIRSENTEEKGSAISAFDDGLLRASRELPEVTASPVSPRVTS
jgi:hypothetical protein